MKTNNIYTPDTLVSYKVEGLLSFGTIEAVITRTKGVNYIVNNATIEPQDITMAYKPLFKTKRARVAKPMVKVATKAATTTPAPTKTEAKTKKKTSKIKAEF